MFKMTNGVLSSNYQETRIKLAQVVSIDRSANWSLGLPVDCVGELDISDRWVTVCRRAYKQRRKK